MEQDLKIKYFPKVKLIIVKKKEILGHFMQKGLQQKKRLAKL